MKSFAERVAAVTGAGSGIGRALAVALAEQGCHLAIADVNGVALEETKGLIKQSNIKVTTHVVDVADREAVYQYAKDAVEQHGRVNIIINNAGVGLAASIEKMRYEDFEWLMGINFWGVVYGTKAFLPYLKQSNDGHIVNISSVFGIIGVPTQSAYNAAKFAVRGFTEALREELDIEGACVSATSVHPGGIKTSIARNSRFGEIDTVNATRQADAVDWFEKIAMTTPEKAASVILQGIRKNQRRVLIGPDAVLIDGVQRILPAAYQKAISKLMTIGKHNFRKKIA
jgi:short-subunit dehydrogenase